MAEFRLPGKIIAGGHAMEEAAALLPEYGRKALVVTGKHVACSSMMEELQKALKEQGLEYQVYDGITGEPTDTMIEEGVRIYRETGCDFCIGIGGGSPLDSAKAIGAMITNPGKIADYNGKTIMEPLPPVLAIVDYRFSLSSPPSVTAATGLDAMTHAVEAYTSIKAQPLSDVYALSAVRRILRWLPEAWKDGSSQEARREMALAALEAGICINNSSVTIVHGMSRPIGALFHVPHGISNAMLLPFCLREVADAALDRFADLGRAVGAACEADTDHRAAEEFLSRLEEICRICQVPTLKEYGIGEEEYRNAIDKMTEDALASGSPGNCRKSVNAEDIRRLYRKAYGG